MKTKDSNKRKKMEKPDELSASDSEETSSTNAEVTKKDKTETKKRKVEIETAKIGDDSDTYSCTKTDSQGRIWNLKIATWNVAGIRAWVKKNGQEYIKKEDPDILSLQETKCGEDKLPPEARFKGYNMYWCAGLKPGYAGVALYSKEKPIKVKNGLGSQEHDAEGRVITAEYEKFYLVCTYVPNAGQGLKTLPKRLKWNEDFEKHLKSLDEKKPVILTGDLNVAHEEIDLANPKTNTKSAGFTKEEREGMTHLLSLGFVDSFRHLYPDRKGAYTFWTYFHNARAKNTGWRLDYFVLSERLIPNLCDCVIRNEVMGSDHCPLVLYLHI